MISPVQRSAAALVRRVQPTRLMSSPSGKPQYGPVDPKIKSLQQFYTDPNNTAPIFLKRGTPDKVLYYATIGLCFFGFANVLKRCYERGIF